MVQLRNKAFLGPNAKKASGNSRKGEFISMALQKVCLTYRIE